MKPKAKPKLSPTGTVQFAGFSDEVFIRVKELNAIQKADGPGDCSRCHQPYKRDDWLFRSNGELVAVNCCATESDIPADTDGPIPLGGSADDDWRDAIPLGQVLPAGKSKADMCPRCFQIPASNGVCGC